MKHDIKPFEEDSGDSDASGAAAGGLGTGGSGEKKAEASQSSPANQIKCEIKEFEKRYNLKGEAVLREVSDKTDANVDKVDEDLCAMRYYKYFGRDGNLSGVTLKIFSPHIRQALQTVIKTYPSQNLTGQPVILEGSAEYETLACFYHYRKELEAYVQNLKDVAARLDVQLVFKLTDKELRSYTERYTAHVINSESPRIAFSDIWMLFKPGALLVTGEDETERILEILSAQFSEAGWGNPASWKIAGISFAHDGVSFGHVAQSFQIAAFKGSRLVAKLKLRPLEQHQDQVALRKRQIARGKKLCTLIGIQHREYSGSAVAVDHHKKPTSFGGEDNYTEENISLSGRVIIDHLTFVKYRTDRGVELHEGNRIDADDITEHNLVCSHYRVPGFALLEKRWCWFRIDQLRHVEWDEDAFELLMLPRHQKRIVRALTRQHTCQDDSFDDLIKGKGRGCIFLLHGEPGIGKTFTVESVAETVKRPLYVMMSGELGSDIETVERNLKRVLKLATTWKAVLLIDEADVFLEKRSSQDLARNGLVSIFLRVLEYFSGLMFLTTNRVDSFDLAFQSRIHLSLKYHPLGLKDRADLWRLFLGRTKDYEKEDWPDELVNEFAAAELNGRQIKNTVRTAHTLALSEGDVISADEIRVVLQTVVEFDAEFQKRPISPTLSAPARSLSFGTAAMANLALESPH